MLFFDKQGDIESVHGEFRQVAFAINRFKRYDRTTSIKLLYFHFNFGGSAMLRPTILCFLLIASFFTTTTFAQTMTEKNETYSYSPSKLMESYRALEAKMASSAKDSSIVNCANPLSRDLVVAAVQLTAIGTPDNDIEGFWTRVVSAIREAAHQGATVILVPELFMGPYFCQSQEAALMGLAVDTNESFIVRKMQTLAKELGVVLPISLYERKENMLFNTIVMIDADGTVLGIYSEYYTTQKRQDLRTSPRLVCLSLTTIVVG